MRYGSVCSGIEAATMAWHSLGWSPAFFSEIEPFPSAVLAHHYPTVPNHGDMTRFQEWPDAALDVLVGGTPCQSFSVAGLRKGMADPRGNLALVYLALADRYRPRWVVWENVPGVLSSNGGRDFGAFLGGLGQLGYGFAYRVLDAQYFGLAQRRKRVFVVASLGGWQRAAAVLFERHGLQGHPPPSREAGEEVAPTIRAGAPNSGRGHGARSGDSKDELIIPATAHTLRADGFDASEDGTGRGTPLVPMAYRVHGEHSTAMVGGGVARVADPAEIARALDTCGGYATNQGGNVVLQPTIAFSCKDHGADAGEIAPMLRSMNHDGSHANGGGQVAVAFTQNQRDEVREVEVPGALAAEPGMKQQTYLQQGMAVRRLTPRECERLQGFPDDFTLIPWRNKAAADCPDGPRYKALGNSMAVPCMAWIGERIAEVEAMSAKEIAA